MSGYVKIYGSILGSSIWAEALPTRIVWITMLALADQNGRVEASVSGLARFANVTVKDCRKALVALASPDPDSKSPEHEGRRVEKVDGGWTILNYLKYREMRSPKQVADAERQKRWREGQRDASQESQSVAATVDVDEAVSVAVKASPSSSSRDELLSSVPNRKAWEAEIRMTVQGGRHFSLTEAQAEDACREYLGNGASAQPNLRHFRAYLERASKAPTASPDAANPFATLDPAEVDKLTRSGK